MKLTHLYATELNETVTQVYPDLPEDLQLKLVNHPHARELSLPQDWWSDNTLVRLLKDTEFCLSRQAVAQKYGGYQFGHWNPLLGDGRGLLLGEVENQTHQRIDLHLKGAGQTPYSRQGDGRAVLRSTLREYIGSEALFHLGIPSSRALCLFDSTETVLREMPETAAMMIRTAPSHLRFGHFEYYYHSGDSANLTRLFEHTFIHHFPEVLSQANPHQALLKAIVLRTARMVALWQAYGFVHGVMNTDNMSVHGITFDFGPYAFIDNFVSNAVFNHTDHQGRYAFDQQPGVALWNLNALAQAFSGYCSTDELKQTLMLFEPTFMSCYQQLMATRLGFSESNEQSLALVNGFLSMLANQQRDYHKLFRKLSGQDLHQKESAMRDDFIDRSEFDSWWQQYRHYRLASGDPSAQSALMDSVNPVVVARTHHLQYAIDAAKEGDYAVTRELLQALQSPFDAKWLSTQWADGPIEETAVSLSCSS
ncbi:protein adenylyltransferase SelO [Salinimonas chungwhensis]|uniref:protein adenylyltransferase SelO n=1 Tax=Salinimonas chungwhensis TaxID=265425 RepID=UPI00037A12E6|nr:YdiU family protein [Salinimonas chungwhensis]